MNTRRLILLLLPLLLAGAIVSILIAWIGASLSVKRDPDWSERIGLSHDYYTPDRGAGGFIPSEQPVISGVHDPLPEQEIMRDFLVEVWEMSYAGAGGSVTGHVQAKWQSTPPADWPDRCIRITWRNAWADWTWSYAQGPDGRGADPRRWPEQYTEPITCMLDTYRVGWPLRSLELRSWYAGEWSQLSPETLSGRDGLAAPQMLTDRGLFHGSAGRIPVDPVLPGFVINAIFYAAVLALPLMFFPARRCLRARCGRCPRCNYDLRGLAQQPCPECGGEGVLMR